MQNFPKNIGKWLFVLFPIIWIVLGFGTYFLSGTLDKEQLGKSGTLGDMFGAVNALFSGLALAGVIYTLIQQQKELEQNAILSAKTSLLGVYSRHIEWYFAERQKKLENSPNQMSEDEFAAFFSNIKNDFINYQNLVNEFGKMHIFSSDSSNGLNLNNKRK